MEIFFFLFGRDVRFLGKKIEKNFKKWNVKEKKKRVRERKRRERERIEERKRERENIFVFGECVLFFDFLGLLKDIRISLSFFREI